MDEDTYCRKVNDRLQDDWIVDDGTGEWVGLIMMIIGRKCN